MKLLKSISLLFILSLFCCGSLFAQANQEFIFIHGVWSDANKAWGNNSYRQRVIHDYQPSKSDAIDYDSNDIVKNGADELKKYLKRQKYNNGVGIAHSKGGLVTRKYFKDNSSGRQIDRLITIGTPHRGTYLINNGKVPHTEASRHLLHLISATRIGNPLLKVAARFMSERRQKLFLPIFYMVSPIMCSSVKSRRLKICKSAHR